MSSKITNDDYLADLPANFIHNWQPYSGCWEHIPGRPVCLVRTQPLPGGYLWQFNKQYGFEKTLEDAKNMAEALREFYPRKI